MIDSKEVKLYAHNLYTRRRHDDESERIVIKYFPMWEPNSMITTYFETQPLRLCLMKSIILKLETTQQKVHLHLLTDIDFCSLNVDLTLPCLKLYRLVAMIVIPGIC